MDPNNFQLPQSPAQPPTPPQAVDGMMPQNPAPQPQVVPGQFITPTPQPPTPPQPSTQQPVTVPNPVAPVAQPNGSQNPYQTPEQQPSVVVAAPKKPKFLLVAVIGLGIITLLVVATVIVARPKKQTPAPQTNNQTQQSEDNSPQPAEAIDVEQSNTSINQDISGLNTDNDFPATELDDKALGL